MHGRDTLLAILVGLIAVAGVTLPAMAVQDQLQHIEGEIAECLARIEHGQARKAQIEAEVSGLENRQAQAQQQLIQRARVLYRVRRSGMLPVAGGFDALLQHLGRMNRLTRIVKADLEHTAFLTGRATALQRERAELSGSVDQARARLGELRAQKRKVRQRSQNLFTPAPRTEASGLGDDRLAYGSVQVADGWEESQTRFPELRGKLALPVPGMRRLGDARREDGTGLEFVAPEGTAVRSAADGRVAFSRRYGDYGRMLIIDHGDRFYTVYGGLGRVEVDVGDWIGMNARIGTVGAGERPALFFEVRRGTRSLDARSWLGL